MTTNDVPALDNLPERLRVHALARLIGRTSREIIAALAEIGVEARSAQSGVERKDAEQVITALTGRAAVPDASAGEVPPAGTGDAAVPATSAATEATDPSGVDPSAVDPTEGETSGRRRTRRGRASASAEASGPDGDPAAAPTRGRRRRAATGAGSVTPDDAAAAPDTAATADPGASPEGTTVLSPIFAPPAPIFQPPAPPARVRGAAAEDASEPAGESPRRRRSRSGATADPTVDEAAEPAEAEDADADADADVDADADADPGSGPDDDTADGGRRRRRRGRRGRGRGRGGDESDETGGSDEESDEADDEADEADESEAATDVGGSEPDDEAEAAASRRRRRRRRRRGGADGDEAADDDPPGTVTRVRTPRESRDDDGDGVQGVRGSTRLEAKRQRRRDGRDAGRRRQPILSEAEYLARRESVTRTMVVRERTERVEIGVLEDDVLVEHFVAGRDGGSLAGNVYLGRVQNVLPSMEAAFVDIGRGRNAVLYAGEVDWDAAGLGGKARRIEQALATGDSVLVQVTKDPIGHKGARLTTQISLAGRFLVYVPSGGAAGISRKLPDVERRRLKEMLKEIVPSEAGVIIRTASEGVSHEALERDVRRLQAQWEVVKGKADAARNGGKPKAPVLLYEEPDLLIKVVRDQFNEDFSTLVVQGDDAWDTLYGYISHVAPELVDRMHRHVGPSDVFTAHRVDEQLLKALDRKVWLPSGGTLVIDRTEAMTVVDVNTGKFTGSGGNLEETVTRNNLEAAEEIVRQMRLRDIGGIIVVDFIDMVLEANRDLVLRRLTECLARDRTRHQVAEVTSLGLVQMTRKRVGGGLLEHFSHPCEACRGRGVIVEIDQPEEQHDHGRGDGGGRRTRGGRGRREHDSNGGTGNGAGQGGGGHANGGGPANGAQAGESGNGRSGAAAEAPAARDEPQQATPAAVPSVLDTARAVSRTGANGAAASAAGPADGLTASGQNLDAPSADPVATDGRGTDVGVSDVAVSDVAVPDVAVSGVAVSGSGASPAGGEPEQAVADAPSPRRRRGRVTRTAGAPEATEGDTPVAAVLTVVSPPAAAASGPSGGAGAPVAVPPSAEPVGAEAPSGDGAADAAPTSRPRRSRRAASRPAGPPGAPS